MLSGIFAKQKSSKAQLTGINGRSYLTNTILSFSFQANNYILEERDLGGEKKRLIPQAHNKKFQRGIWK